MERPEEIPVTRLKNVGAKRQALYQKIGIQTVGDLLRHYPRDYIDYSDPCGVLEAPYETPCVVRATVFGKQPGVRVSGGRTIYRVNAGDDGGSLIITFFNSPWAADRLEEGRDYLFYGRVGGGFGRRDTSVRRPTGSLPPA